MSGNQLCIAPDWPQIEKVSMKSQFSNMALSWIFFWRCFVSLVKFSYWSKFQVNIITGSGIMTISLYKGLNRNPEIANTPVWVLPNIWRLEPVTNTKVGKNVSNKNLLCYWMLQNTRTTAFTAFELLRENQQGGWCGCAVELPPPPPPSYLR